MQRKRLTILGCRGSGTTMVSDIVDALPGCFSAGDYFGVGRISEALGGVALGDPLDKAARSKAVGAYLATSRGRPGRKVNDSAFRDLAGLRKHVLGRFAWDGKKVVAHKETDYTALTGDLLENDESNHVLFVYRDPLSMVASNLRGHLGPYPCMDAAVRWRDAIRSVQPYWTHERFHPLCFEQVLKRPEWEIFVLASWLGVDYCEDAVGVVCPPPNAKRYVTGWSRFGTFEGVEDRSAHLTRKELSLVLSVCWPEMVWLGYSKGRKRPAFRRLRLLYHQIGCTVGRAARSLDIRCQNIFSR